MGAVPGNLETENQPPMTVPLRHFVAALVFLLAGGGLGVLGYAGVLPGGSRVAHVHLLLAGWVCLTIMGAMTQFVPVWSGVELHSQRLATAQLQLVAGGLAGFALVSQFGPVEWLWPFGAAMLAGFWTFVYNVGRTLRRARPLDVTERHFALALSYFLVVTVLGLSLAVDFASSTYPVAGVGRPAVLGAHATLAVFGAVLTTVLGALYQLATMFTQSDLHGVDQHLRRLEEVAYPVGTVLLASARLVGDPLLGRVGGGLLLVGVLAFAAVLWRRLLETQVDWTPMLRRYAVLAVGLVVWALAAAGAWAVDPLSRSRLFGPATLGHLLVLGVVATVVLGTLYHVVPFIVWVHRYSDRLGLEPVPMIDDLYDDRIALADLAAFLLGTVLLVGGEAVDAGAVAYLAGGPVVLLGFGLFVANMMLVIRRHSPHSLAELALGTRFGQRADPDTPNAGGGSGPPGDG